MPADPDPILLDEAPFDACRFRRRCAAEQLACDAFFDVRGR
jgi:hypothetical protein